MLLQNTFEGGTNGQVITTGNSGGDSGDAFSYTQNATYTSAQAAHGSLSAACSPGSTMYLEWESLAAANGSLYGRVNFRIVKPTSGDTYVVLYAGTSETGTSYEWSASVVMHTNGTAQLELGHYTSATDTFSVLATKNITLPSATWCRLELRADNTAPTSTAEARWYNTVDGTTITDSVTASTSHTSVIGWAYCGVTVDTFQSSINVWVDDVAVTDTDWLGPAGTTTASKTGTDTAALADQAGVTVDHTGSDTATLGEQAALTLNGGDTVTLVSEHAAAAPAVTAADGTDVAEQAQVQATHVSSDTAALIDQADVAVAHVSSDAAAVVEATSQVALTAEDAADLAELPDINELLGPAVADIAALSEQSGTTATLQASDTAALAEQPAVTVLRYGADTATIGEVGGIAILATDGGTAAATATIAAELTIADTAAVGELAQAVQPVFAADAAVVAELAAVISLGGDITAASPPYIDWAARSPYV